mmetsp:Transcript_24511/g.66598  ORF Transcript_24511/g.66598 Transcript_24511/m.66598 type:complete len:211 (-) Transcript_24511:236-868(-)
MGTLLSRAQPRPPGSRSTPQTAEPARMSATRERRILVQHPCGTHEQRSAARAAQSGVWRTNPARRRGGVPKVAPWLGEACRIVTQNRNHSRALLLAQQRLGPVHLGELAVARILIRGEVEGLGQGLAARGGEALNAAAAAHAALRLERLGEGVLVVLGARGEGAVRGHAAAAEHAQVADVGLGRGLAQEVGVHKVAHSGVLGRDPPIRHS